MLISSQHLPRVFAPLWLWIRTTIQSFSLWTSSRIIAFQDAVTRAAPATEKIPRRLLSRLTLTSTLEMHTQPIGGTLVSSISFMSHLLSAMVFLCCSRLLSCSSVLGTVSNSPYCSTSTRSHHDRTKQLRNSSCTLQALHLLYTLDLDSGWRATSNYSQMITCCPESIQLLPSLKAILCMICLILKLGIMHQPGHCWHASVFSSWWQFWLTLSKAPS